MKKELALVPSKYFNCTPVSLEISKNTPIEEWMRIGELLKKAEVATQWWLGDWFNFGMDNLPAEASQALDPNKYDEQTLRQYGWVAKQVKSVTRVTDLPFTLHREVASLGDKEQVRWLKKALEEGWSVRELKSAIKKGEVSEVPLLKGGLKVEIELGDFRRLIKKIPDGSISLVLTDPPYPKEYLGLWEDLSRETRRVLKPGGFLVSYSGQTYLPQVMESLGKHLDYYWLMGLYHKGPTSQRFDVNMWNRFKPILVYCRSPREKQDEWMEDMVVSEVPDKDKHEWGQSVEPFVKLMEAFSKPGDLILDPMFGGGAVIEAAIRSNRNIIGFEIDKDSYNLVKKRIK